MLKWVCSRRARARWTSVAVCVMAALFAFPASGSHAAALSAKAAVQALPSPPGNSARAAALADVVSGRILFNERGDERMKIASLTKIMTAIVAIEHANLDGTLKVSDKASKMEGSSIYLKAGERMKLRNALYGLMLRSGNDAATAIAEHVGGSVEGFVFLMNKKAEEIGLSNSHFMNPSGLDEQGHYSSANDLAKLTVYALRNPTFKQIVATKVKKAPNPHDNWDYEWVNKNKMLNMYDGADGVKTGYTKQALRTLVSSATREGQQLVAVTLNDRDDWIDHRRLLDYGFANYPLETVAESGQTVNGYPYKVAGKFVYPFAKGERERLELRLAPLIEGTADFKLGYRGQIRFVLDGKRIGSVPLVEAAPAAGAEAEGSSGDAASRMMPATATAGRSFAESFRTAVKALFLPGGG
ncbi:D-alanyl-D-alanine carboxypeptidase family protein [Cohnella suwonensis]|uniref:D-alanyl-D-alanine carboxypeptidase family protein n=1 Tax=Cohnella suwonensis TaxID=696072 RepID=A0ABW0LPN1_9BACL